MYSAFLSMAHSLLPAGRHLKELSRTQWMKGEQIRAIQLKRLRSMLQHCYRTVPFYHRAMKDAGIYPQDVRSLDDLCRLPSVGKAEIRKAPFLFRSRRMPKGVFEESTSGSTAEPFRFLRSRRTYEWELGAQLRFFGWTGYRLGDRWAVIYRVSPFKSLREQFEDAARDVLLRRLRVNDWKISEEGLRRYAKRIFSFRPFLLVGLPKNLLEFGRFAHQENAGVPVLVSTMERIAPFERRLVNEMWGGEVYDMYGSAEARSVASECGEHDGLHISDELYVLEFVRDGEHVSPGEQGRILVTSLCHWVQPFIRYDTGDLSTSIDEECPCGRGLSLMSTVEGRYWDILETEDGRLIFAHRFADWFGDVEVRQYQIEQQSRLKTIVRIVPDEGYSEESGETIAARTKAILGSNVEVEIRVVDFISDYESGKRQVVKSKARFPAVT